MYEAIVKGRNTPEPGLPESFNVLVKELQGLGLDVNLVKDPNIKDLSAKGILRELNAKEPEIGLAEKTFIDEVEKTEPKKKEKKSKK